RFTPDGFVTSQIFTRNPAEERAQLELLDRMLAGVTAIVTYNGKSFDIPILKTRYILNGLPSPLNELVHFDLLPLSRRLWRRRLENRSLKDIESEILSYTRSQMEVPGWEIPVLYFNYLRTGDPSPLAGVFYHNAIDIQSLAALFLYMNQMAQDLENPSKILPIDTFSMAIQLESTGEIEKAVGLYEQLLSVELPEGYVAELKLRYSRILKRNGDFTHAAHVLHNNQELTDIRVIIQLAKVMEHQHKDIKSALEWTEKAIIQLDASSTSFSENIFFQQRNDLMKRKNRLLQKLENTSTL
ncbi:MAG TPA: ribonuclease H-like domain-containing protein, partial [Leptolinea sp.]